LTGDETVVENMRAIIQSANYKLALTSKEADTLILCEGPAFPFTAVIKEYQSSPGHKSLYVHGNNTSTAVGSDTKHSQGNTII
jgi:hypothetical protein